MTRQTFKTTDVLRLEVETDPVGLTNLVQNPNGELGGWGWITTIAGSKISGDASHPLRYDGVAGASWFTTEAMPMTAGHYAAARFDAITGGVGAPYARARFEWLDSTSTVIGSSAQTGYFSPGVRVVNLGPQLAPANTMFVRLRFDMYKDNLGGAPTAAHFMEFAEVTVAKAATSGALGTVRANLMPNPSFETSLSGWRTGLSSTIDRVSSPVAVGSWAMRFTKGDRLRDVFVKTPDGTGGIPVQASTAYTLQFRARSATTPRGLTCVLYWYNASGGYLGREVSPTLADTSTSAWTTYNLTALAPASAAYVCVSIALTGSPAVGEQHYFDAFHLEAGTSIASYFDGSTAAAGGITYEWTSRTPVVTARTNRLTNPSFETNTTGWAGENATIARVTTPAGRTGTACLRLTSTGTVYSASANLAAGSYVAVTPGTVYSASAYVMSAVAAPCVITTAWYNGATQIDTGESAWAEGTSASAWRRIEMIGLIAPAGATHLRIGVKFLGTASGQLHYVDSVLVETSDWARAYFDGATAITEDAWITSASRAWTGTANASTSTQTDTTTLPYSRAISSNLSYIPPVQYLNIMGDSIGLRVDRDELNVGALPVTLRSRSLDPSVESLIRPGRQARLTTLVGGVWQPIITGRLQEAAVTYDLKDPRIPSEKRAKIEVLIVDPLQSLANAKRPEAVGTIAELPYVLEGAGVPWSVNGSGNQVPTAAVTALNENASALDQVALTRDTALGFAWMNRLGIFNVRDAATMPTTTVLTLDEGDYTDLDTSFNTKACINEVVVVVQSTGVDGSTDETTYGPFTDPTSIAKWGRFSKTFTVTGLDTTEVTTLANNILAANAEPKVQVNSVQLPIASTAQLAAWALTDLYDKVLVSNTELGISDALRVTKIEHTVSAKPAKWMLRLYFGADGGVATPTTQPPVQSSANPDVGVVEMFAGTLDKIPTSKILCDGRSLAKADYPYLFAVIGYTFGGTGAFFNVPNFDDRFPIGAGGAKALGSIGGTNTHTHPLSDAGQAQVYSTGGTVGVRRVATPAYVNNFVTTGTAGTAGGNASVGAALRGSTDAGSSLPPWGAIYFVIRAV